MNFSKISMAAKLWVNIDSVNYFLPDGDKLSPKPMWTYHSSGSVEEELNYNYHSKYIYLGIIIYNIKIIINTTTKPV